MTQPANPSGKQIQLDALFDSAVAALTVLDAEAIESLAETLSEARHHVALPKSPAEWERAASRRWIFAHLLGETARRLAILRRVSAPGARFGAYGGKAADDSLSLLAANLESLN